MIVLFEKGYCPIEPIWEAMGYSPEDMKQMIADNFGTYFDPNYNKAVNAVIQGKLKGMDITKPPRGGEMTPEGEVSLPEGIEGVKEGLENPLHLQEK